jgi:hypothetical protein
VLRESDAITGQLIQIRRSNVFATVAGEIAVTEIVSQNENDVGSTWLRTKQCAATE